MNPANNVPVVLFIHSRPKETAEVLKSIRGYKPQTLYVVADGAREGVQGEAERCLEARNVVQSADWGCEVHWMSRDRNMGSGKSVKEGLDWVFSREKWAIILEDDTVPNSSFFPYCEQLLVRYEDEPRVGMISGNNLIHYYPPDRSSYFFSRVPTTWGWATWRRAWTHNDFHLSWLNSGERDDIRRISLNRRHLYYWKWAFRLIHEELVDAWDWQWNASLARQGQLAIVPRCNLVRNIGFGVGATHTFSQPRGMNPDTSVLSFPMRHPLAVESQRDYEKLLITEFLPDRRPEVLFVRRLANCLKSRVLDYFYRRVFSSGR